MKLLSTWIAVVIRQDGYLSALFLQQLLQQLSPFLLLLLQLGPTLVKQSLHDKNLK
jgi:hypothetical protein